ncbi:uncharacterized protein LOC122289568 isoform X4 [Carya illinoinensis]|uniref:uncharacterized protein LOC122289568 isoform X4 n=1 Tax=Carya illinoinensis TaxID=32201 RepID=UPI001C72873B|nr:uncharacterized protein LOC122289568 isoform X4 [Carya illinoinensis]
MNVKRGAGKDSHRILEQPMETSYRTLSEKGSLENAWRQRLNGAWSARSEGQVEEDFDAEIEEEEDELENGAHRIIDLGVYAL